MNEDMRAAFESKNQIRGIHKNLDGSYIDAIQQAKWEGYQAALSQQEQLYDACDKAKSYLSEFAKVAKASGLNIPSSWEFCIEQQSAQPTVKESLTVQVQPSCEPAGYFVKSGTGEFIQLIDPQDRTETTALYTVPADFAALRAERDKLQQLLMTALDTGRAAIAERDALKERNDELVGEITKALSFVECSHRPPVKDSLETGRMVNIRLHALADLHAIIRKESK